MARNIRICLLDRAASHENGRPFDPTLHAALVEIPQAKIFGEFENWQDLQQCLTSDRVDVVILNLDDAGERIDTVAIAHVAEVAPNAAIVGVSRSSQPDSIITAMRAGCSQYVRSPVDTKDLIDAVHRSVARNMPLTGGSTRICVLSASGGAGATTIACNLAMELAQLTDSRCALVDLNLEFGEVALAFDCKPAYSVVDLCRGEGEIDTTVLESVLETLPCNVSILARPQRIEEARDLSPEGVDQMLRQLGQFFPFVVVDMPRSCNAVNRAALEGAGRILLVTQLSVPHLRNASRLNEYLHASGFSPEQVQIVLNRCNASFENISVADVEKHFNRRIYASVPNDYRHVTNSRDLGHPIVTDAPKSPARRAIHELAQKLVAETGTAAAPADRPNSGWLDKLFAGGPRRAR